MFLLGCLFMSWEDNVVLRSRQATECEINTQLLDMKILQIQQKLQIVKTGKRVKKGDNKIRFVEEMAKRSGFNDLVNGSVGGDSESVELTVFVKKDDQFEHLESENVESENVESEKVKSEDAGTENLEPEKPEHKNSEPENSETKNSNYDSLEPESEFSDYESEFDKLRDEYPIEIPKITFLSNIYTKIEPPNKLIHLHESQNCPFELNSNYADSNELNTIKPILDSIRRDHYLLNLSPFGPNNQLRGFRDTLILAIYLNRTIVLPPFFKHRTDPSVNLKGYSYQDSQQKLDAHEIAKLLPVITLDEFSRVCEQGVDEVFLARESSIKSEIKKIETFESILKMRIINRRSFMPRYSNESGVLGHVTYNKASFRNDKNHGYSHNKSSKKSNEKEPQIYVAMSKFSANYAYGTNAPDAVDGKCAMWLEPYRNTLIVQPLSNWVMSKNLTFDIKTAYTDYSAFKHFGPTTSIWSFLEIFRIIFGQNTEIIKVALPARPLCSFY